MNNHSEDEKPSSITDSEQHQWESNVERQHAQENAGESASAPVSDSNTEKLGPKEQKLRVVVVMGALCLAVFLSALDFTIVTTAIPEISKHFNSAAGYTWVGSAYFLSNAASTPAWGKISDIWGRKPILLLAVTVFFLSSLVCGVSTSMTMLIAGRVFQGAGAGGIVILANICIGDLFSMRDRGFYYGVTGLVWALASCVGPLVGGVLTNFATWRWIFYINLPLAGVAFLVLLSFLHLKTPKTPLIKGLKAIDWLGSVAIIGATVMFLLGLEFGVTNPWTSPKVLCLVIFGLLLGAIFFVMPLRLFHDRSNVASLLVCFFHGFTYVSGSYYLPLYFQGVRGSTAFMSGVYLIPYAAALSLASAGTGAFIRRTGRYLEPVALGMAIMVLGYGLFIILSPTTSVGEVIAFEIIAGIGVGPALQGALIALQNHIDGTKDNAAATATFGFARNIATTTSVAVGGVLFGDRMRSQGPMLREKLGEEIAGKLSGGSAAANTLILATLDDERKRVVEMAFGTAMREMWVLYVCTAAAGFVACAFIRRKALDKKHKEVVTGLAD